MYEIQKKYANYLDDAGLAQLFMKERSRFFIYTALKYHDYSYANALIRFVMDKEFSSNSVMPFPVKYGFVLLESLFNVLVWKNYKQKLKIA